VSNSRFRDTGQTVYDFLFGYDVLIECPTCGSCAVGKKHLEDYPGFRLICKRCGILPLSGFASWGSGSFMGYPLWLRTNCCAHLLWAYNKPHLEFLDQYVASSLRERMPYKNQSLASRLPSWIKSSKNRDQLQKGLLRLKEKIIDTT